MRLMKNLKDYNRFINDDIGGMTTFAIADIFTFVACIIATYHGYTNDHTFHIIIGIIMMLYLFHTVLYMHHTSFNKLKSLMVCVSTCAGMCIMMMFMVSLIDL